MWHPVFCIVIVDVLHMVVKNDCEEQVEHLRVSVVDLEVGFFVVH